jgi:signal transduction histidine kinase
VEKIVHPDDRAKLNYRLMTTDDGASKHQFRIVRPDGEVRWLLSRMRREPLAGPTMLLGVTLDITDRRRADEAQRESLAKSHFLSRVSHELRTPLNAVIGFTQLLQAEPDLPQQWATRLGWIRSAGEHLLLVINDMLSLSGVELGELKMDLQAVSLDSLVREALRLVEALAAQRGVALELRTIEGVAYADRTRLRQVLVNPLSNAIKYNRERVGSRSRRATRATGLRCTSATRDAASAPSNWLTYSSPSIVSARRP